MNPLRIWRKTRARDDIIVPNTESDGFGVLEELSSFYLYMRIYIYIIIYFFFLFTHSYVYLYALDCPPSRSVIEGNWFHLQNKWWCLWSLLLENGTTQYIHHLGIYSRRLGTKIYTGHLCGQSCIHIPMCLSHKYWQHSQIELCMINYARSEYVHFHWVCVNISILSMGSVYDWYLFT